jgi:hypothetical protein
MPSAPTLTTNVQKALREEKMLKNVEPGHTQ